MHTVINSLIDINYSLLIHRIYEITIQNDFAPIYTEHEYMELIYSFAIPFIIEIESKNYNILEANLKTKFLETIVSLNVKNKIEKIYQKVENFYNENKNESPENIIKEVKKFCEEKKYNGYKDLLNLQVTSESLFTCLNLLIGKEKIIWLDKNNIKQKLPLKTFLYYYQNLK